MNNTDLKFLESQEELKLEAKQSFFQRVRENRAKHQKRKSLNRDSTKLADEAVLNYGLPTGQTTRDLTHMQDCLRDDNQTPTFDLRPKVQILSLEDREASPTKLPTRPSWRIAKQSEPALRNTPGTMLIDESSTAGSQPKGCGPIAFSGGGTNRLRPGSGSKNRNESQLVHLPGPIRKHSSSNNLSYSPINSGSSMSETLKIQRGFASRRSLFNPPSSMQQTALNSAQSSHNGSPVKQRDSAHQGSQALNRLKSKIHDIIQAKRAEKGIPSTNIADESQVATPISSTRRELAPSQQPYMCGDIASPSPRSMPKFESDDEIAASTLKDIRFHKLRLIGQPLKKKTEEVRPYIIIQEKKRSCVIQLDHPLKICWNLLVQLVTIGLIFYLPLDLSFSAEAGSYSFVHAGAQAMFALDVILSLLTTRFSAKTGEQIVELKSIVKDYASSWGFLLDILVVLPLGLIDALNSTYFRAELLMLLKYFRIQSSSWLSGYTESTKLSIQLLRLMLYLVIYIHFTACFFYNVVARDQGWVPWQTEFASGEADFYDSALKTRYLTSVYAAILILQGDSINPQTDAQIAVVSFFTITGALIIANIFGTIAVVVSALNRKSQKFQEKIDSANTSMANMKLPPSIQQDIREFMTSTQNNLDTQKELDAFMQMISPSLRNQVTKHIFLNAIASNPVLQGSQGAIDGLVSDVSTLLYLPEDRIITQGEQGTTLYLIAQGDCSVWVLDHLNKQTLVRQLNQGEYFGEVAILFDTPRTATVKSSNYCTLAALSRHTFYDLNHNSREVIARMRQRALEYDDPWKQFKQQALARVDYFRQAAEAHPQFLDEASFHLKEEQLDPGTELVNPEHAADSLMVIVHGAVDLIVFDQEGSERALESLGPGDILCPYSPLFDEVPIFTALAKTRVKLLALHQDFFVQNRDLIPGLKDAIAKCEAFVEQTQGIPWCDFIKGSSTDSSILEKFHRARRRAQILEKSLLISRLNKRRSQVQNRPQRAGGGNSVHYKAKRHSILVPNLRKLMVSKSWRRKKVKKGNIHNEPFFKIQTPLRQPRESSEDNSSVSCSLTESQPSSCLTKNSQTRPMPSSAKIQMMLMDEKSPKGSCYTDTNKNSSVRNSSHHHSNTSGSTFGGQFKLQRKNQRSQKRKTHKRKADSPVCMPLKKQKSKFALAAETSKPKHREASRMQVLSERTFEDESNAPSYTNTPAFFKQSGGKPASHEDIGFSQVAGAAIKKSILPPIIQPRPAPVVTSLDNCLSSSSDSYQQITPPKISMLKTESPCDLRHVFKSSFGEMDQLDYLRRDTALEMTSEKKSVSSSSSSSRSSET